MPRKRYRPTDLDLAEELCFPGALTFLRWIDSMLRRPPIGRAALPIVLMAGATPRTLEALRRRASSWWIRPPSVTGHSVAVPVRPALPALRAFLDDVVTSLGTRHGTHPGSRFKDPRPIRFRHYALVSWLIDLGLSAGPDWNPDDPRFVGRRFREFANSQQPRLESAVRNAAELAENFPGWLRLLARWAPAVALATARLTLRSPRWLIGQTLPETAENSFRQTVRAFARQDPDAIDRGDVHLLLVEAFLEDLRRAYDRESLPGVGRRRTSHILLTVALDDGPSDLGATTFLECVETARRSMTSSRDRRMRLRWDPLLVVASCTAATAAARTGGFGIRKRKAFDPASSETAFARWTQHLHDGGEDRSCSIPFAIDFASERAPAIDEVLRFGVPSGRYPATPLLMAAVLLAGVMGAQDVEARCGALPWENGLTRVADQCIGLAPERLRFLAAVELPEEPDSDLVRDLAAVESIIHRQNDLAVGKSDHLTVAYMGVLTPTSNDDYRSLLEELRGIAAGQNVALKGGVPLRILLANGGPDMREGATAAATIADAASADPRLIAVVGMGVSSDGTRDAINVLRAARLPMVGTVISATDLATQTQYYRQVGPTNALEAKLAAAFVADVLRARRITLLSSDDVSDLYSTDLARQARSAFGLRPGLTLREIPFRASRGTEEGNIALLAEQVCSASADDLVFYAGRSEDMRLLLNGVGGTCTSARYPRIVGGDDLSRFALGDGLPAGLSGLQLYYIAMASSLAWGDDCALATSKSIFFAEYAHLSGADCVAARDGSAQMAYDTISVVAQAVRAVGGEETDTPPTPQDILRGLTGINGQLALNGGASGRIDFGPSGSRTVPLDKSMLVLKAEPAGQAPRRVLLCGSFEAAQPPADTRGCPPPEPGSR